MGGQRGASHKRVDLVMRLPQLQNLIKRDPAGYKEEFMQQYRNYASELEIFKLTPGKDSERFSELVTFVSHAAPCYKAECAAFPVELTLLLEAHGPALAPPLRMKLVQALMLARNRGMLDQVDLLRLLFRLFGCQDKPLRQMLYEYIVADIRNVNRKGHNEKLNKALHALMYTMIGDASEVAAKRSLDVIVELYRRRVWTDARTVNAVAAALHSERTKLCCTALNFFLNIDGQMADDDDDDEDGGGGGGSGGGGAGGSKAKAAAAAMEVNLHKHSKKTRARARDTQRKAKARKAALTPEKEKDKDSGNGGGLFPAIMLLQDPQGTAEKVFRRLRQSNERFEVKLLMMNFVSRLVGAHRLLLLPLYSHLQRYLTSHQREVTKILAFVVQGCHDLVPPDELLPVLKAVAHNFITERCSGDVAAVGMNAVREVVRRVPALLWEPDFQPLAVELSGMTKSRDKSVVVAARGVLNLVREMHPTLLRGKDRGRAHDATTRPARYGEVRVLGGVDGAELLQAYEEGRLQPEEDGESGGDDGESGSDADGSDDSGESISGSENGGESDSDNGEEEEGEEEEAEASGGGQSSGIEAGQDGWVECSDDDENGDDESGWVDASDAEDDVGAKSPASAAAKRSKKGSDTVVGEATGADGEAAPAADDAPPELVPLSEVAALEAKAASATVAAAAADSGSVAPAEKVTFAADTADGASSAAAEAAARDAAAASCKRQRPDMARVLTAEDFALIKRLKAAAAADAKDPRSRKRKRSRVEEVAASAAAAAAAKNGGDAGAAAAAAVAGNDEEGSDGEDGDGGHGGESFAVEPSALEGYKKRRRATLEERLESVIRGREKFEANSHGGGLTNLEKARKKNFLMVRKGQRVRSKTSGKQVRTRDNKGKKILGRDKRKKRRV